MNKQREFIGADGTKYLARREPLKRDGGNPPGQWYWTVDDDGELNIDQRVPEGYFPTLAQAREVLEAHIALRAGKELPDTALDTQEWA